MKATSAMAAAGLRQEPPTAWWGTFSSTMAMIQASSANRGELFNGLLETSPSNWEFDRALDDSCEFVSDFARALANDATEPNFFPPIRMHTDPTYWPSVQTIDRDRFTDAVARYLRLPIRDKAIDEVLIFWSIALEYLALRDFRTRPEEMKAAAQSVEQKSYWEGAALIQSPWSTVLTPLASRAVFYFVAALAGVYAFNIGLISSTAAQILAFLGAAIVAIDVVITAVTLPKAVALARVSAKRLDELLVEIESVLRELRSLSTVHTSEVIRRARLAEERGVRWPSVLFPLLSDVAARRTTIFDLAQ